MSPNLCQMKVQEKIFKLRVGHFYVRSLLHGVICVTKCQRPSNCFFLFFLLLSPGHFSVNDLFTVSKQLAIRFQRNFACILMGSVRIAVQNFIDLVFDLDLSRSQMCKITFGPYLGSCWTNRHQILTQGSLGRGLSTNQKIS